MISSVALKNFKAFKEVTLPLAPLTMLSGVNAVGKSTVLQALTVLRQSSESDLMRAEGGLILNGDYVEIGTGADLLHDDFTVDAQGRPFVQIEVRREGEAFSRPFISLHGEKDSVGRVALVNMSGMTRLSLGRQLPLEPRPDPGRHEAVLPAQHPGPDRRR